MIALYAEYEAGDYEVEALGSLSLVVLARVPLGEWDEALAGQVRMRELLGEEHARPPSFAAGGYGGEALILDARGETSTADAVRNEVDGWLTDERPRKWPLPQIAIMLARRGDYAGAHGILDRLADRGVYLPRELEARCVLVAEEGAWDEAGPLVERARRFASVAKLVALPFHADRLEGRALLAAGEAVGALGPLERAVAGFASLDARWEVALTELSLGEALAALERNAAAAEVLARAAAEFERLRVPRELERAQQLLSSVGSA